MIYPATNALAQPDTANMMLADLHHHSSASAMSHHAHQSASVTPVSAAAAAAAASYAAAAQNVAHLAGMAFTSSSVSVGHNL
jgi:hypothetical protein